MKLRVNDWKHAWFESHISDRFFQEMSKLERGSVQGLETSAQWTEQIMVEVGALAQAMIRLEQEGAPEPQIRQAYEKSLRLAALAMHLITALDGADREKLRSAAIVRTEPLRGMGGMGGMGNAGGTPQGNSASLAAPTKSGAPQSPFPPPAAPAAESPAAAVTAPPVMPRQAVPWRPPLTPSRAERTPDPEAAEPAEKPAEAPAPAVEGVPDPSVFASLLQHSGPSQARSESAVHQTILSLAQQGLSRAEIESVTGEPRHIIEAVLNNARAQTRSGSQSA